MFACDFEATTQRSFEKEGKVRIWAWQCRHIKDHSKVYSGKDIESFLEFATSGEKELYFHNLKYDGNFIIDALFRNDWKVLGPEDRPKPQTFETLITDTGQYFMIILYLRVYKTRSVRVVIKDSLKKLPLSIDRLARVFNMEVLKGEIDYHKYRPVGYEPTEEEWEYINNDTLILATALKDILEKGMDRLTIASDALNNYKEMIGTQVFDNRYPTLDKITDDFIRQSYRGGFTWVRPDRAGVVYNKTTSYDVNSLYPSVMYYKKLPIGYPIMYEGKYEEDLFYPLYIQHIRADFKLKPNHIPTIQGKQTSIFQDIHYIEDSEGELLDLYLTSVDLKLFEDHYDIYHIEYVSGYKFQSRGDLFKEYIDYWSYIKETTTGGERELAKLMLNSLYGKFGQKPERRQKIPYLDEESGRVRFEVVESEEAKTIYTAMASFITAYAREITIRDAQANYDRFIYADTDSIHLIGHEVPDNLNIHDTKLGYWACEGLFGKSKFLRPKTYIKHNEEEELEITCAGLPKEARKSITFENFKLGASFPGKLSNSVVKGGSLLKESNFTIKV